MNDRKRWTAEDNKALEKAWGRKDAVWLEERFKRLFNFSKLEKYALGPEPAGVDRERRRQAVQNDRNYREWTLQEIGMMEMMLKDGHSTKAEISAKLGRSMNAIVNACERKGLMYRPERQMIRHWTTGEISQMEEMLLAGMPIDEVGRALGRTNTSVHGQLYKKYKTSDMNHIQEVIINDRERRARAADGGDPAGDARGRGRAPAGPEKGAGQDGAGAEGVRPEAGGGAV